MEWVDGVEALDGAQAKYQMFGTGQRTRSSKQRHNRAMFSLRGIGSHVHASASVRKTQFMHRRVQKPSCRQLTINTSNNTVLSYDGCRKCSS